jgi:mannitol operon transcriptional antiterminator
MQFLPRTKQIIILLLNEDKPVSTKELAEKMNISKRTVQRELDYVSYSLKKYNLDLASKTGLGIWIYGSKDDKDTLLAKLSQHHEIDITNKDERKKKLIMELLKEREPKKIYYYSNKFKVSEATIRNDLDEIEDWMNQFNLKIVRKQGYGVCIEGKEDDYRKAMKICIDENLDKNNLSDIFKQNKITVFEKNNDEMDICNLFNKDILEQVISCLEDINDWRIQRLTEDSYFGLVLHITIAIERCLKDEIVDINEQLIYKLRNDENYKLAEYISKSLENQFHIEIPEIETAYICLHIKASKLQYANENISREEEDYKKSLLSLVQDMIESFDSSISFELKCDEDFLKGLVTHLQPTIVRLNNKMAISNPLLDQIKDKYADIYEKSIQASKVLENKFNVSIPEDEIGFLALHFGAAMVRLNDKKDIKRKVKAGVVCASGIGVSRLMSVRINKVFKGKIEIITLSMSEITDKINDKIDFLITSIALENIQIDHVKVNPLLLEDDLEKINEKIRKYECQPEKTLKGERDFSSELSIVAFVAEQINIIIRTFKFHGVDEDIEFSQLLKAVGAYIGCQESREVDIQAKISKIIEDSIMEREKLMSQVMPEFGFALLHSRCSVVKNPYFMVCRTHDNTYFKDEQFKKIETVIIMIIPKDEHMKENADILGCLSSKLVEDDEFLDTIKQSDEEGIRSFISSELSMYFSRYLKTVYND